MQRVYHRRLWLAAGLWLGPLFVMETYAVAAPEPAAFRTLTGLYEPSAIQQLPDGRFIVVED